MNMTPEDQAFAAQISGGMGNAPQAQGGMSAEDAAFAQQIGGSAPSAPQSIASQPSRFIEAPWQVAEDKKGFEDLELMDFAKAAGNYLPSLVDNTAGIVSAFASPLESIKALSSLASGIYKLSTGGEEGEDTQMTRMAWEAMKTRYGDSLRETMVEDPAGIMLDLVSILAPMGGIAGKMGMVSKAGTAAKWAGRARKVADLPGSIPMGAIKGAIKAPRAIAEHVVPNVMSITSGKSPSAIRQMFRSASRADGIDEGSNISRKALRGGGPEGTGGLDKDFLVDELGRGVDRINKKLNEDYERIVKAADAGNVKVDLHGLKEEIYRGMKKKWGVTVKMEKTPVTRRYPAGRRVELSRKGLPNLRFFSEGSSTSIATGAQKEFRKAIKFVDEFEDASLRGLDNLQQRITKELAKAGDNPKFRQSSAFLKQIQSKVMDKVMASELGPAKKMYAVQKGVLDDIDTLLSGSSPNNETIMRKIIGSLEGEDMSREMRRDLIQYIDDQAGTRLMDAAAGGALSSILPTGIHARETAYKATGFLTAGAYITPWFWMGLPFSSPRLVGEFMRALGLGFQKTEKVTNWLKKLPGAGAVGTAAGGAQRGGTIADVVQGLIEQGETLPQAPMIREFSRRKKGTNVGGEDNMAPEEEAGAPAPPPQSIGQRVLGGP